jgi:hypothetical protein
MVNGPLRLILGGGGSKLKTYRRAASKAFSIKHPKNQIEPLITLLQKPDDFQMAPLPDSEFHRFAVAYGLSFPIGDLPEPILAQDVLPVAAPRRANKNYGAIYEK